MTEPTKGPGAPPPHNPSKPPSTPKPMSPSDSKDAFLLNSPFAKMFRATGAMPTVKEIKMIINGILKEQITHIKRDEEMWKKAMKKMKEVIEGND